MRYTPSHTAARVFDVGAATAAAFALNLRLIDHPPRYDELLHVLAAISWADDGTLSLGEGQYTRAALFTRMVGAVFRVAGTDLETARLLAAVPAALLVGAVFAWTRSVAGRAEAWVAAVLLAMSTVTLTLATMVRFYSLHALLFFAGAILCYSLVEGADRRPARMLAQGAAVALSFWLCFGLQMTTVIGVGALLLWLSVRTLPSTVPAVRAIPRATLSALVLGSVVMAAAVAYFLSNPLIDLWHTYRSQALWASGSTVLLYHWWLQSSYPVFYGLLPGVLLLAAFRYPRLTLLCGLVFFSGIVVHSFGGMRGEHYVFYLLPFFFIICGIATVPAISALQGLARSVVERTFPALRQRLADALVGTTVVVAAFFLIAATPGLYRSLRVIVQGPSSLHIQYSVDWAAAQQPLARATRSADVIVTTNSMAALYYLGRFDVEMSATILHETPTETEFDRDERTGRPVISSAKSLQTLIDCYSSGLVVAEEWQWQNDVYGVNDAAAALLRKVAAPVELPAESQLVAYRWSRAAARATSQCPDLSHR